MLRGSGQMVFIGDDVEQRTDAARIEECSMNAAPRGRGRDGGCVCTGASRRF